MKLSSLIDPRLVRCGLAAQTREDALRELVELMVAGTHLANKDVMILSLGSVTDPNSGAGHVLRISLNAGGGNNPVAESCNVMLQEGAAA